MKESPRPPQNFSRMYDWRSHGSCLLPGKNPTGCADTVSAVSGIRLPPECRFCWGCKRRKQFNAGVPGAVAPGKTNLWSPPSRWEGGDRAAAKAKGSVDRRQRRQALPFGTAVAGRAGNQPDKPPARVPVRQGQPVPLGFIPGDARGGSPLHKNNLGLPLPAGKGAGDGGRKERDGSVSRRQRKHAPTGARVWQGQPAPQAV